MEDRPPEGDGPGGRLAGRSDGGAWRPAIAGGPAGGPGAERPAAGRTGPEGLGGWLILTGLGLIIAPFGILTEIVEIFQPLLVDGTWAELTRPGGALYHPWWAPLLIGEIAVNVLITTAYGVLIYLFFARKRDFPNFFALIILIRPFIILIDAHLGATVFNEAASGLAIPREPVFDPDTARNFVRAAAYAVIWIPYMFFSKRVKNTFTRPWRRGSAR